MPTRRERSRLRLAVADDTADEQIGVVERSPERVGKRVAELAALVDRPGRLGRDVARDPTRERELPKQRPQPVDVRSDVRVDLAVGALQIGVRDQGGTAVAGSGHVDGVQVARTDRTVEMRIDEIQTWGGAKVTEQPRLHVLWPKRLPHKRVVEQIDLADREIVSRAPVGVDQTKLRRLQAVPRPWSPSLEDDEH